VVDAPGSVFAPGLVFQTRYRIDEPLAAGGMAQVWRGEDLVLQRQVAIKLLHPHLAAEEAVMERFRHEAIAAARLAHPNIVPTFDTGADHGVSYIVLGLVDGPSLARVLSDHSFTPLQTCTLGRQIADALDHAHHHGIVHRDIKPANVLVVDEDEHVMVADFGIARLITESLDPTLTVPGLVLGTPEYIAPELAAGVDPTPAVDIYALGILLHEMHCGHAVADVPTQDVKPEDAGTPQICPDLPEPLGGIVAKATRPHAEDRYISAAEMSEALRSAEAEFRRRLPPEPAPTETEPNPTQAIPSIKPPAAVIRTPTNQPVDVTLAQVHARRRKIITFVAIALLIGFAIAVGRFFGSLSENNRSEQPRVSSPASVTAATSFDPLGSDRTENEASTKNLFDSNPATVWNTETYGNRRFGNLKQGVGVSVSLSASSALQTLKVQSPSSDWAAEIYVAEERSDALSGWGRPITASTSIASGSTSFNLNGTRGDHVLIWITDLGNAGKVSISDLQVTARASGQ
jgi:serine/threonine protein kinase